MKGKPNIVIFGAGAIGGSVGAWIASRYDSIYFLDMGKVAEAMRKKGITLYQQGEKEKAENIPVKVISDLSEAPSPDIIVVAVKTYSLDGVSKLIKDKVGNTPVIVALQNGVENQKIFPNYFSKVIYGVICYNAWLDEPALIGYQKRGPLVIGTLRNDLQPEMEMVGKVFNLGVETFLTDHFQDAAHCKMVINLTNSLTTLIGHKYREVSDPKLFQKLLTNLTYEGVQIIKAEGYKECKLGGMPGWSTIRAACKLPRFLTKRIFEKNVKKMVISSMAQDIIQRKGHDSELDSLNGYFLKLADKHGLKAPYNRAVYDLCKKEFAKPEFKPFDVTEVWEKVKQRL